MADDRVIALVNNDATFRWTLSQLLDDNGYSVRCYRRDAGVSGLLTQARPTAIILEASFGGASTTTLIVERLRAGSETRYTPIFVCSPDDRFLRSYGEYLRGLGCLVFGRPFDDVRFLALVGELTRPATPVIDALIHEGTRAQAG
jgi:hypothetical protein